MTDPRHSPPEHGSAREAGHAPSPLERLAARPVLLWLAVLLVTVVGFYVMNHAVMVAQGLPLNLDLTPAQ